ncbi:Histone deacetylase hda1 [Dipsacomyces acuminosporus]|nr:Histone deacetylase hda1 [Dipsacomyces acuminosporus]
MSKERRVGYVYDVRMKYHLDLEDPQNPHPEDPQRIYWIYDILDRSGCLKLMQPVRITPIADFQILRVHTRAHLEFLKQTELQEKSTLLTSQEKYNSVYLCKESHYCARLSAGGLLSLCEEVVQGRLDSGIAIIRPPGHHACANRPMGFCLYNNIAIAIRDLQTRGLLQKVMVVDWDVHHGNGIQEIFYSDEDVLYFSIHRHESGEFYPCSSDGGMDKVGKGPSKGLNINVPWIESGMGDGDYMYAFRNLLLPVAKEFSPDMIIVASGFDAAVCDPIGECNVSPECYACMTSMLRSVANGKLVLSLEGGYNLDAIANSALACAKALLDIKWKSGIVPQPATMVSYATISEAEMNGLPQPHMSYTSRWDARPLWDPKLEVPNCYSALPSPLGKSVVDQVVKIQRRYWRCLTARHKAAPK